MVETKIDYEYLWQIIKAIVWGRKTWSKANYVPINPFLNYEPYYDLLNYTKRLCDTYVNIEYIEDTTPYSELLTKGDLFLDDEPYQHKPIQDKPTLVNTNLNSFVTKPLHNSSGIKQVVFETISDTIIIEKPKPVIISSNITTTSNLQKPKPLVDNTITKQIVEKSIVQKAEQLDVMTNRKKKNNLLKTNYYDPVFITSKDEDFETVHNKNQRSEIIRLDDEPMTQIKIVRDHTVNVKGPLEIINTKVDKIIVIDDKEDEEMSETF